MKLEARATKLSWIVTLVAMTLATGAAQSPVFS